MTLTEEMTNPKSCLNNSYQDEPIFVLRGQDMLAPALVREWAMRFATHVAEFGYCAPNDEELHKAEERKAKYDAAMRCALEMEEWPNRKMPD